MAFPTARGGVTMDSFYSATIDHLHEKGVFEDNVFMTTPLYAWLKSKGQVKPFTGGAKIEVKIMHGSNGTVGSYGSYEELDISPQDGKTTVYYDTAEYAGAITLSNKELAANRSKEQAVNLVMANGKQTALTFGEKMSQDLHDAAGITVGAGVGTTGNSGKNILGLPLMIHYDAASTAHSLAGLDPVTNASEAFWVNQLTDYGATNTAVNMANKLSDLYVNITAKGPGGQPDFGVCDLTTWTKIVAAMETYKRYATSDEKLAGLGFENVKYLNCSIAPDPYCSDPEAGLNYDNPPTAGVLYMLHSDYVCLYQRSGRDFKPGPMKQAPKQMAKTSLLEWEGQLVTNNRRKLGVLFGITKAVYA